MSHSPADEIVTTSPPFGERLRVPFRDYIAQKVYDDIRMETGDSTSPTSPEG